MTIHSKPSAKNDKSNVEYERFTNFADQVFSVPHSLVKQRIKDHGEAVANDPPRRGPKSRKS